MEIQSVKITAEKVAEMLGINGRIFDLWTTDYSEGIEITYVPANSDLVI